MISFFSNYEGFGTETMTQNFAVWINEVIILEGKKTGDLQYVFCSDDFLLDINKKFLHHDYYTDIVTFSLSKNINIINGEIYISVDRVKDNAGMNNVSFDMELSRVIIHGVLHLVGYDDHTDEEKRVMRSKEDYYLTLLKEYMN